ncbi:MAG: methyltransferase domain-containing protein [Actinomycetota bacterium]|nr:methyltransferase domain-containing protein [Actinomycetota bacterium]
MREYFDRWSKRYESSFLWRWFFRPLHKRLLEWIQPLQEERILDVGCGTGALAYLLSNEGAESWGADISPGMLELARERAGEAARHRFVEASADALPFDMETFDRVISVISFHHYPDPHESIKEMYRVLVPGGHILICDMCGEGVHSWLVLALGRFLSIDEEYYSRAEMKGMLEDSGFVGIEIRLVRRFPRVMLAKGTKPDER